LMCLVQVDFIILMMAIFTGGKDGVVSFVHLRISERWYWPFARRLPQRYYTKQGDGVGTILNDQLILEKKDINEQQS
jgi:hypothetical protein